MGEANKASWADNFTCKDSAKFSSFKNYMESFYNDFVTRNYINTIEPIAETL
jgi:hypothetical protein